MKMEWGLYFIKRRRTIVCLVHKKFSSSQVETQKILPRRWIMINCWKSYRHPLKIKTSTIISNKTSTIIFLEIWGLCVRLYHKRNLQFFHTITPNASGFKTKYAHNVWLNLKNILKNDLYLLISFLLTKFLELLCLKH